MNELPPWTRALARLRAEPGKASVLAILMVTMAVLWARAMFFGSTPTPARAAAPRSAELAAQARDLSPRPQASPQARHLLEWTRKPRTGPGKDLFTVKLDFFRRDDASTPLLPPLKGDGFWEQVAKSMSSRADQERARNILLDNVRQMASKLELQSTFMASGAPQAVVNGTLVREGEMIEGFKVIRIEAKRIVVEREGIRLEVAFKF